MKAHAKINLALVVGPVRGDGKHEVATVYQRLVLADDVDVEPADRVTVVEGFAEDTLVSKALQLLDASAHWRVRIEKRIPVAAGLGGGSSDAAAALRLANSALAEPVLEPDLHRLAARLGADVPFFLHEGPQLGTGDGSELRPLELPQDYHVVLLLPDGETKRSTGDVYAAFDARDGPRGWDDRRARLLATLEADELEALPPNDLAGSPHAADLRRLGAFRADVSGAGPTVYGLFRERADAAAAASALEPVGRVWISQPAW